MTTDKNVMCNYEELCIILRSKNKILIYVKQKTFRKEQQRIMTENYKCIRQLTKYMYFNNNIVI